MMLAIGRQFILGAIAYVVIGIQSAVLPRIGPDVFTHINLLAILTAFALMNFGDRMAAFWTTVFAVMFGIQNGASPGISVVAASSIYVVCFVVLKPTIGRHPAAMILSAGIAASAMNGASIIQAFSADVSIWNILGLPVLATMTFAMCLLILAHGFRAVFSFSSLSSDPQYVNA